MSITSLKRTERRCTQAAWTMIGIIVLVVAANIIAIPLLANHPSLQVIAETQTLPILLLGPTWGILAARRRINKAIEELQRPVI